MFRKLFPEVRRFTTQLLKTSRKPKKVHRPRARLGVEALETRNLLDGTVLAHEVYGLVPESYQVSVEVTVSADVPGYEGLYLWQYHVTSGTSLPPGFSAYFNLLFDAGADVANVTGPADWTASVNAGSGVFWGGTIGEPGSGSDFTFTTNPRELVLIGAEAGVTGFANLTGTVLGPGGLTNLPPVADYQTVVTDADTAVSGNVTATDPEGVTLTYSMTAGPAHGMLTFNSDGSFTYTPDPGFIGLDSFTFTANDGNSDSNEATEFIAVAVAAPLIYTVDNTGDAGNGNIATLTGDLRWTITQANANPGHDVIRFKIPGAGVHTINLTAGLPRIDDSVVIDATTQANFAGQPVVHLNGAGAGFVDGLDIAAGSSTVKGLIISGFSGDGIWLHTNGGNIIATNFIGTDATGREPQRNTGYGVRIDTSNNRIGGLRARDGNVISGNGQAGVVIGFGSTFNTVIWNYIGVDSTGFFPLGNTWAGVTIEGGSNNNYIGTTVTQAVGVGNVISANGEDGVLISGNGTSNNYVAGNYIGTDFTGMFEQPNGGNGVSIINSASNNTIGGVSAVGNVISGNTKNGIEISLGPDPGAAAPHDNHVYGNYIGLTADGTGALGNGQNGVFIRASYANDIGDSGTKGNVISANTLAGVHIEASNSTQNKVAGNYIGTDVGGTVAMGNRRNGVEIEQGAHDITIGGDDPALGNVISANGDDGPAAVAGHGISISGGAYAINVKYNYIGTQADGTGSGENRPMGNFRDGIYVEVGTSQIVIAYNISSDNGWRWSLLNPTATGYGYGIDLGGSDCTITGNILGFDSNLNDTFNVSGGSLRSGTGNTWQDNLEQ